MTALNKQAQYRPKSSRLWERYDEAAKDNAVHMREILEQYIEALEAAERHIAISDRVAGEKLEAAEKRIVEINQRNAELTAKIEPMDRRIAELEASHSKLRDTMAGIHNTIRMDGGYTPLAAILNAAKRAYEDSATAAGIGVKGD